jgi:hypothetical protein
MTHGRPEEAEAIVARIEAEFSRAATCSRQSPCPACA